MAQCPSGAVFYSAERTDETRSDLRHPPSDRLLPSAASEQAGKEELRPETKLIDTPKPKLG